ncbi:MAG: exo-alpha-sialidase [Burkholderiaceae bacterium]
MSRIAPGRHRPRRHRPFAGAHSAALALAGWLLASTCACGPAHAEHAAAPRPRGAAYASLSPFKCGNNTLACATSATPVWAGDGALWLAWVANGDVMVGHAPDGSARITRSAVVGRYGALADIGPDARVQIAIDAQGRIVLVFGIFKDEQWNAQVLVATSHDGGKTFGTPHPVTPDAASQRFASLGMAPDGALFVAWVDKRLVAAAARQGRKVAGASIAYAWSTDGGASFSDARLAHETSCECCRIGVALPEPERPVVLFRDLAEPGVRDHALLAFGARHEPGALHRVAVDDWHIDACPHHGPALAVGGEGRLHAAWYTAGRARQGVFYAHSPDGGRSFSAPMRVGRDGERAGRPALLARGPDVWLAYKAFDGQRTTLYVQRSRDAGQSWSAPEALRSSVGYTDHPMLGWRSGEPMLSWLTHDEGLHLTNLRGAR